MSHTHPTIDDLSPARQRLVALMRDLGYGQIRNLRIEHGEPIFDPPPSVVRAVQVGAGRVRLPRGGPGYRLKPHILDLFDEFDALGTGVIEAIKVQDGLPVHLQVAISDPTAA